MVVVFLKITIITSINRLVWLVTLVTRKRFHMPQKFNVWFSLELLQDFLRLYQQAFLLFNLPKPDEFNISLFYQLPTCCNCCELDIMYLQTKQLLQSFQIEV